MAQVSVQQEFFAAAAAAAAGAVVGERFAAVQASVAGAAASMSTSAPVVVGRWAVLSPVIHVLRANRAEGGSLFVLVETSVALAASASGETVLRCCSFLRNMPAQRQRSETAATPLTAVQKTNPSAK